METRKYQSGAVATPPSAPGTPSVGYPTNGNPGSGVNATQPGEHWFYKIGEELRAVIAAAGLTPSDSDLAQIAKAIQAGTSNSASATGTANALIASYNQVVTQLLDGMTLKVRALSKSTSATVTFTPNSGVIAAKNILKGNGLSLDIGDIAGAGHWLVLNYDVTLDAWILENPAKAVVGIGSVSLAANGYEILPNGKVMQWGYVAPSSTTRSFPIAFPNACFSLTGSCDLDATLGSGNTEGQVLVKIVSNTQFRIRTGSGNVYSVYWQAIGN